jgi:hypothetical protein
VPAKRHLIMTPAERGHRHELQPAKIVLTDLRDNCIVIAVVARGLRRRRKTEKNSQLVGDLAISARPESRGSPKQSQYPSFAPRAFLPTPSAREEATFRF